MRFFLVTCLLSRKRLLTGLTFLAMMVVVLLLVRGFGMTADSTVRENMKLVNAEIGLIVVTAVGIFVELRRRAYFHAKHRSRLERAESL